MKIYTTNPDDTERLSQALVRAGFHNTTHVPGNGAQCWIEIGRGQTTWGEAWANLLKLHIDKIILIT